MSYYAGWIYHTRRIKETIVNGTIAIEIHNKLFQRNNKEGVAQVFQEFKFTQTEEDLFENILKTEDMLLNHVVMEVGKAFPRHATDAEVFMIINKGEITIETEEGIEQIFKAGQVLNIPMGTETTLSNKGENIAELFVIKRV